MGFGSIERIPDQFLSDDDIYVFETSITWFMRLLSKGIPLDENAIRFSLKALNDRAPEFLAECKELITVTGPQKLTPGELEERLQHFDDLEDHSILADNIEILIKKCGVALSHPLASILHEQLSNRLHDFPGTHESNLDKGCKILQTFFRLNETEVAIILAVHLLENWDILNEYFDSHLSCREQGKSGVFSTMLNISQQDFNKAISGKISRLELVDKYGSLTVDRVVESIFTTPLENMEDLFYKQAKKELLPLEYFPLEEGVAEHILALLKADNTAPTHILLYGEPGAGKSSFAATAAHKIGQNAYNVRTTDNSDSSARKKALEACLNMTGNGQEGLVIVDEADNLLNTEFAYIFSGDKQDKGWLNEFLERPGTRTIWITNDTFGIPDSVMRRFAYSVKFQKLGRDERINIWQRVAAKNKVLGLLTRDQMKTFAVRYPLSAGSIDMAIKKAKEIAGRKKRPFFQAVERSLIASQQLISGDRSIKRDDVIENDYSLEGLNLDADMSALLEQLDAFNAYLKRDSDELRVNMNLLFYGPPGTGKTELSRYLSRHLKRELIVKRTSDLLSAWVGQSEQQIAKAFRQAEKQRAVLVIDEADSLLFSRDKAVRSWETSMVNEFLTQMEHFRGLLICTTNRMDELDSASLRRFNHKIFFDFLGKKGVASFYDKMLAPLVSRQVTDNELQAICHLKNLTPGDFKIIRDRFAFYPKNKIRHADLVQALARESAIKNETGRQRAIGF
ncbi:AAA family ATPase [Pseudodesulfovibrio piezophilus]|uniref:Putative AAA ATPase central domain protein n=1 Tax=Pseudodesulfovibrio piezophilus (strain DSM 21447 / JCM 15486 / C1TLV30) TaxID=1322246 RepID=M1WMZ6_PSEP2|nr:ATP-binding protein [Pseudodesulfovibrio piezophilus]CCH50075.1 putative AAA ATPase central domain protein [Pseudodesulfovibrio piezophilus C1TLV30]